MTEVDLSHTAETPPSECPSCGHLFDRATGPCEPRPGDITICINCRHICTFDDAFRLREPTEDELKALAGDPQIIALINAMGAAPT